jgi:hypothetical protein
VYESPAKGVKKHKPRLRREDFGDRIARDLLIEAGSLVIGFRVA